MRAVLGVCLMFGLGLAAIVAAAYLWMPNACDIVAGPKIDDPRRADIWARASERDCSGMGAGFSRSRIEVGRGTSPGKTVFAQDSEAPDIRWSGRGELEIDVRTTEQIVASEVLVDDIEIRYVVPHQLTKRSLEQDLSAWEARTLSAIRAGKVVPPGGSKTSAFAELDRDAGIQQAKIDRFVTWSDKVHARFE